MSYLKRKSISSVNTAKKIESEEDFLKECQSIYLSVFNKLDEEITSPEELVLLLQHGGRNPSKKTVEKYWGPSIDSYNYDQFCAILKQEDKTSKTDLLKAFQKIDRNADGFITHDELYQILTKRGERMTKAEVKSMIEDADFNGDGKLDYQEFCEMMDTTTKQCSQLYKLETANKRPIPAPRSPNKKQASSTDRQRPSFQDEKRSSIMNAYKNSTDREVLKPSKSLMSAQEESGLRQLKTEPHDLGREKLQQNLIFLADARAAIFSFKKRLKLSKWTFYKTKGCFFKNDDGSVESHHLQITITQPTAVWITISAATPKYGKFDGEILDCDMTAFLTESKTGRLLAFTNSIIDGKNCLQAEVNIGIYDVFTFSTGCKLNDKESSSGQVSLVKGKGDNAKLTRLCRDSLLEIFYRCDLDGNGFLSHDEFNEFQKRSSGEGCDAEAWLVVKETIEVTPQFEMTPNGFIHLNTMEARDPDGGPDELWVTLESMGYNKKLLLTKACPFVIEIFTKNGQNSISLLDVNCGGENLQNTIQEAIKMVSTAKEIKSKRDLILHTAEFVNRTTLAIENMSHAVVGVQVDCSGSENLISDHGTLIKTEEIKPKSFKVLQNLVSDKKDAQTSIRHTESIL